MFTEVFPFLMHVISFRLLDSLWKIIVIFEHPLRNLVYVHIIFLT